MEGSLVDRIIPPRRAATQATASYSELTEGSGEDDSPRLQDKSRHSNRGKGRILVKPRSSVTHTPLRATVSEFLPSTSAPGCTDTPRPAPRPLPKKPKQPITPPAKPLSHMRGSDSDLTPISSPICSPALNPKLFESPETPRRIQSQKRRALSTSNPSAPYLRRPSTTESWDVSKLGTYVWVLLDSSARVLEPADITDPSEQTKEWLWWPGKIKSPLTNTPLKVHLFGDAYPGLKNIEIHSPCHMNILSLEDSMQRARFDFPTFVTGTSFSEDFQGSPRKKQKHDRSDQEDRWGAAVAELLQEKEDDQGSDAMPEVGTLGFVAYVSSAPLSPAKSAKGTPRAKGTGKGNAKRVSDPADDVEISDFKCDEDRWSPPPADDSLEIPGELLFARDRQSSAIYWPAKILEYVPPKKRTQEPKYCLEFLDNTVLEIPRKLFFTSEDEGFTTCKVGKWESAICDVLNDDENDEEDAAIDAPRSTSPVPSDPPPPSAQFIHLHIREQFVYVKSVLKGLLNGEYAPVKRQHDLFIGGGLGRKSVCDEAGLRGRMDPRDVAQLQTHLIEWCLRDEKRAKPIVDEVDPTEPEGWSPTYDLTGNGFEEDLPLSNVRGGSLPPSTDGASTFSSQFMPSDSFHRYPSEEAELPPMSSQLSEDYPTIALSKSSQETKVNDHLHSSPMQLVSEEDTGFPRQRGCEGYEALATVEKIDYCVNVLLPEAILQILLWRGGHRTTVELLSDEEERELHEKGEELRKERDWVYDVMRLRKLKLKQMQGMSQASSRANDETNGRTRRATASGRPKRNVAMPKSYLE